MKALHRTYLDGTDLERGNEMLMRFRLTYEGPLLSSNPLPAEDIANPQYRAKRQAATAPRAQAQTSAMLSQAIEGVLGNESLPDRVEDFARSKC